jgi:uncharacterized protein (TIGR02246 family)
MTSALPIFLLLVISTPCLLLAQESSKKNSALAAQSVLTQPAAQVAAAINEKDATKAASFYTEDATLMPSDAPMAHGRKQVEEFVKQWLNEGVTDVVVTPITFYKIGERGYEVANFELSAGSAEQKVHVKGKLLTLLRKDPDNHWRMEYEIWNTNPSASH